MGVCPEGTYPSDADKVCYPCHSQCGSCRNASDISCISCKSGSLLVPDAMQCVSTCPTMYFTSESFHREEWTFTSSAGQIEPYENVSVAKLVVLRVRTVPMSARPVRLIML